MKTLLALALLAGCGQRLQIEPVTVKPIHVVVDINVHDTPDTAAKDTAIPQP